MGGAVIFWLLVSASRTGARREEANVEAVAPKQRILLKSTDAEVHDHRPHRQSSLGAAASAGEMTAQRPASLDSNAGSISHNAATASEALTALVEMEAGMTNGNKDPNESQNFIVKFFKDLAALCTRVEADEYEIEVPTESLQTVLQQFPKFALYMYIRDENFVLTKGGGEPPVVLHMLRPVFKVMDDPKIIGSTIVANVQVWDPSTGAFAKGLTTLFDKEGDLATLVRQPHGMQKEPFQQPKQLAGDEDPGMDLGVDWGKPEKLLGKGNFGKVFKTTVDLLDGNGSRVVAVKVPMDFDQAKELLLDEIYVMEDVAKVDAIKSFAVQPVYSDRNPPILAMEFAAYGDLQGKIRRMQSHPACFWRILLQLSTVFWHMPLLNHRDIKPDNIMLFKSRQGNDVNFKLGDFGLASNNAHADLFGGTPGFMPPEATRPPKTVTRQADVFGLGVTVLQMILGDPKAGAVDIKACKGRYHCTWQEGTGRIFATVPLIMDEYKRKYNGGASASGVYLDNLEEVLKTMTHPDPGKRARFSELKNVLTGYMNFGDYSCPLSLVA